MSDKKVEFSEMAKSISTLVSAVAKSIQNGLWSFEKSSGFEDFFKDIYGDKTIEIEKIKFILKEVIKKREKMGKKSSAKKIKKEVKNFEKNKVEDLEIKEEKIFVQDINLKELSKYEKIKKFRDLRNINIIYSDKKDKLKKFQEIYTLINSKIKEQDKKWIFSKKDNIYYVLSYKIFTTERFSGKYDIFSFRKEENEKHNLNKIKKVSNRIREKGFEFSLPDEKSLKLLEKIKFIGNGDWIYYSKKDNNIEYSYSSISNSFYYDTHYRYNLLGICKLDKFFNFLEERNKKYNLLENDNLKNFEVILNYDLLDTSIITKEYKERFNKLIETYKTYKEYISCIYNEDSEKIGILFNINKVIASIKNDEKLFNNIEITYSKNQLGIEKEKVYLDRNVYYYENGDIEEVYNTNSEINYSIYYFSNKDIEKRTYQNGILNGKSILKFSNGDIEERIYKDGILKGKAIYKNENKEREYFYTNGVREEMPKLKYYLSIDRERINIDDYQETMLTDPNIGHWDLKEEDKKELKEILGKNVYKRDSKLDINQGGIVAIDFGTKSTVVVYQKDSENILPMRISGDKLNREVRNTDYENPTVIEFRDINKFLKDYKAKVGRPDTKWEDITVSHTAFGNLTEVSSEHFDSIISDIKQWTASKNQKIVVVDRKGKEILLPPYLELNEKSKDYLDPVELYAYYIGSYINNMINGIYLEYYLSFPVTYEKTIREKILKSFEKGIQKSLPIEIQEDKDLMKKFRVRHGANEPAAFAVCALSKLEIGPKNEEDKVYYGVFDFGGGTTDFDFGIWKYSEEEDLYDYELEHFGAGGERYLGGENILKELAYKVFTDNSSNLRKNKIQYTRPEWCDEISGEEILVSQTKQARQNSTKVAKELRGIWENTTTERVDYISVNLFDSDGEVNAGFKLDIKEDNLKNLIKEKIEKGIKNFFIKMEDAFKGEDVKEVNIFLAGNSCKHPFVEEIFNRYIEEKKDKLKINIYNTKMFDELKETNKANPTAKTGVAFGLIYSRNSGRIKVISRDEKANIDNEINFKFYVGNNRRNKFNCLISPDSSYDEFKFFGIVKSDIFELYYSTSPEAQTNEMKSSEAKIKRVNLKKDYDEEERYRIYLKAEKSDKLAYAIVKEEKDIETKEFIEEGEILLN
ncbi:hypothetical protein [Fusobacterium animalis]|uniref:hypothetical protein n=1 Tax=Fusobacterium animalis TaxID=76859 RepID=UPI0034DEB408